MRQGQVFLSDPLFISVKYYQYSQLSCKKYIQMIYHHTLILDQPYYYHILSYKYCLYINNHKKLCILSILVVDYHTLHHCLIYYCHIKAYMYCWPYIHNQAKVDSLIHIQVQYYHKFLLDL